MTEEKKDETTETKKSGGSSTGKAFAHLAEAVKGIANRVPFVSENEQRDVQDHVAAAVAHSEGDSKAAKAAAERIAERNPDSE
jgi:hypothetical protein